MTRETVFSHQSPHSIGPYSHAVWADNLLYISGQTPIDPETNRLIEGDITPQTAQAFINLEGVLLVAGLTMDDVIKCNVYLTTMKNFAGMNAVYEGRFKTPYPARTTVGVAELPLGALVEIEMVAKKPGNKN